MPQGNDPTLQEMREARLGQTRVIQRDCPLCEAPGRSETLNEYTVAPWTMRRCLDCGFVYIGTAPDYAGLRSDAAWEHSSKVEDDWRDRTRPFLRRTGKATRWRLHLFPRKNPATILEREIEGGNVLDIGCGDGHQLAALGPQFVPFGIEISRSLASFADRRCGMHGGGVVNAPAIEGLDAFPDEFFHAAILRSYLEHEENPAAVLRKLHTKMVPYGIGVVKVPNFASLNRKILGRRWSGFRHPDHLNYFTPRTLSAMADKCGFRATFPGPSYRLPTSDNMWAILIRRKYASAGEEAPEPRPWFRGRERG